MVRSVCRRKEDGNRGGWTLDSIKLKKELIMRQGCARPIFMEATHQKHSLGTP